mgnify:CR=1 FL=1
MRVRRIDLDIRYIGMWEVMSGIGERFLKWIYDMWNERGLSIR